VPAPEEGEAVTRWRQTIPAAGSVAAAAAVCRITGSASVTAIRGVVALTAALCRAAAGSARGRLPGRSAALPVAKAWPANGGSAVGCVADTRVAATVRARTRSDPASTAYGAKARAARGKRSCSQALLTVKVARATDESPLARSRERGRGRGERSWRSSSGVSDKAMTVGASSRMCRWHGILPAQQEIARQRGQGFSLARSVISQPAISSRLSIRSIRALI